MTLTQSVIKGFFITGVVALLVACVDDRGTQDLEQYVAQIITSDVPEIEPLPVLEPLESYAYAAAFEGNPFSISNVLPKKRGVPKAAPLALELDREREILEYFPIDSLKMVGTLNQRGTLWAIVVAPDDMIHRVKKGNYIGTHLGEILEVLERQIVVEETVESGDGKWEKRKFSVVLPE